MSLDIQFFDRDRKPEAAVTQFAMTGRDNGWVIPEPRLTPVGDGQVFVTRIATQVANDLTGTGLSPEPVARRIQAAFPNGPVDPPKALGRSRSLVGILIPDAGPLPPNFVGDLTVTIGYRESKGGQPSGPELVAVRTCRLTSPGCGAGQDPFLAARPDRLAVAPNAPASFVVEVRFPNSDAAPTVALAHPDSVLRPDDPQAGALAAVLPEFRTAVTAALSAAPVGPDLRDGTRVYTLPILLRLPDAVRNAMERLPAGLNVPLDVSVPGTTGAPCRVALTVEVERHQHPGWVVIDFGTCNSTATVHDPHIIRPTPGLPKEQRVELQRLFARWVERNNKEGYPDAPRDGEWRRFFRQIDDLTKPDGGVTGCLTSEDPAKLYALLAEAELALSGYSPAFRRSALAGLHGIYHAAMRIPTLERFNLYPITLDRAVGERTLLSEMEILTQTPPSRNPLLLDVVMGKGVQLNRRQQIAKADGTGLRAVLSRFHPSPKRYFGTTQPPPDAVELPGGQTVSLTWDDLMVAGWRHMLGLADGARRAKVDGLQSDGPFRKLIVTYPTSAPPSVRNRIRDLITSRLGIGDIQTDYDEAVAAAIFYFMREYASVTEMGLESFKARCRLRGDRSWVQNVLVFDTGGGTTDVALIELTLEDVPVFEGGEDRGAGGRFYRIKPRLRSSTGSMQLGGELMSLRAFRMLKASLADTLLSLVQAGKLKSDALSRVLATNLPAQFQEKSKFQPGSLRAYFELEAPELGDMARWQEAKELADRVLPTRWKEEGDRRAEKLQAFDTLWRIAEEAKIALGKRRASPTDPRPPHLAHPEKDLRPLLEACRPELGLPLPADALKAVSLEVHAEQMEKALGRVVQEAVMLAMGTLEHLGPDEKVDWLILSGQSCNLELVDTEIRKLFAQSDKFVWNPERVTFEPTYAKLATSLGACFAEEYRRRGVDPKAYKHTLRKGLNFLEYAINNLFSTLPCYFDVRLPAGETRPLFRAGDDLFELDPPPTLDADRRAKARTVWGPIALQMTVMRQDYKSGQNGQPAVSTRWGDLSAEKFRGELQMPEAEFRRQVMVQFEVDHRLNFDVLLCRMPDGRATPDHVVRASEPQCQIGVQALPPAAPQAKPVGKGAPPAAPAPPPAVPGGLFDADGKLRWELAVRTPSSSGQDVVFPAGLPFDTVLHPADGTGKAVRGLLCPDRNMLDRGRFPADGKLELVGRLAGTDSWTRLGVLRRPSDEPVFRRRHRLSLSEDGVVRVHEGEPAYWETDGDPSVLKSRPGCVYRVKLEQIERKPDADRDPYSGMH